MNAKKLAVAMSALVLGLTSCGGNSSTLTRKEAETKLDEIVAATPATYTKLTSTNGTTSPAAVATTYTFDATSNYSHIKFATPYAAVNTETSKVNINELFAYADGSTKYVFGYDGTTNGVAEKWSVTIDSSNAAAFGLVAGLMANYAQGKINDFVKCGREHWHNGAGGLSAYLKRQDTIDQDKKPIVVSDTTIEAGATEKGSYIALVDEKYSSTGEGNLTLDFDALYPNPENPAKLHEPLLFEFNDNVLTHWYNKKASSYAGNEWYMDYTKADIVACDFTASTEDVAVKASTVVTYLSAKVAADQPTDEANLYPAKWGTK